MKVLGALPRSLPPLAALPLLDLDLIGELANGALALAIIGLVEAVAIARAVASHSRQRLDSNQEFVGQGLANIAAGLFSGYPCSGSFNLLKTSTPRVLPVVPDDDFRHFVHQPHKPACPQLSIMDILGDLYFGATSHIETAIHQHRATYSSQRFLLLRMHSVNYCDLSGIQLLESIVRTYLQGGMLAWEAAGLLEAIE